MSETSERTYERNPYLLLEWSRGSELELLDCRQDRRFRVTPELLALLSQLDRPLTAEEIHARWTASQQLPDTNQLLSQLLSVGIIRTSSPNETMNGWTAYELAAHHQAARGPRPDARKGRPPSAHVMHNEATCTVVLPDDSEAPPSEPLAKVLNQRRSIRRYSAKPLPFKHLAALLHRAARVYQTVVEDELGEMTYRPAPSGGARHSIELYLLARNVSGLDAGAYHYDAFTHTLHRLAPWSEELTECQRRTIVVPAQMPEEPPASFYLASYFLRTGWKYKGMTLSLIYRDTGCLMQTLCLAATDLGLASCLTARIESPVAAPFLLSRRHEVIHVGNLALGLPTHDSVT
ncbi:SagB family peptide dehydrogenase [Streptomyces sp. NPDC127084]|uniref:SagB family peptide dehydrogenase n=1 Tax=Streptomyces sp. NPDC127084 TaxID=3347133 RepID=UPI00365CD314